MRSVTPRAAALLAALALAASALALAPAPPAAAAPALPLHRVALMRGTSPSGAASPHASGVTVVPGSPAHTAKSHWAVTYDSSWDTNAPAKAAFQTAVDTWAGIITSTQTITVDAHFGDLGSGVLGYAGPYFVPYSVNGVPSYYPLALANALSHSYLNGGVPDIDASFSSTEPDIYYGLDSNPPAGFIDFQSVVLHELGHGLGFTGSADYCSDGQGVFGDTSNCSAVSPPFVFDRFNANSAGTSLLNLADPSAALGAAFTSGSVFWNGAQAVAANGSRPRLYAPGPSSPQPSGCPPGSCDTTWVGGSSIAHLDEDAFARSTPNSLMTPYLGNQEVVHSPGQVTVAMLRDLGWNAVLAVPGAPTGVTADPQDSSMHVTWTAPPENGSPISGYTVNVSNGTQVATNGTATSATVPNLVNGTSYTFSVQAANGVGVGAVSAATAPASPMADTTPPTVTVTSVHATGFGPAAGTYTFVGTDPGHPVPELTFTCTIDSAAAVPCTSPWAYSGYPDGSAHAFSVTATDGSHNTGPPSALASWTVDAVAPTVTSPALPTFSLAATVGGSAVGVDRGSGIKSFDYRYRAARFNNATFTALTYPASWRDVTSAVSISASQGFTYCFAVRARDRAGNLSAWSVERCTTAVLDDRNLAASAGWQRVAYPRHFQGTVTSGNPAGMTLTRTGVRTRQIAFVGARCHGCGPIGVFWNGRLLANVSMAANVNTYQQVRFVHTFPGLQTGTLVLRTLTNAPHYLDGVGLSAV